MIQHLKCKFCGKAISVEIDDGYSKLGDPFKLMRMASCNPCADMRTKKRDLEFQITALCRHLIFCQGKNRDNEVNHKRDLMFRLTKDYATVVAQWEKAKTVVWDAEFPEQLLNNPENIRTIVGKYWETVRHLNRQPDLVL